ncbi:hypothetical protein BMS3Bbin04_00071 [bacterium BMS3Bbin04]|nr:hypothetical protein BMS3Bbin04_00071 [bacterium BMS3Bbin04]
MAKKKSKKKLSWFNVENQSKEKWLDLCPLNTWKIVSPDQLPTGSFPQPLLDKCDSVFVMTSGSDEGVAYCMANANRIDERAYAIDQQPFGLAFIGESPAPSGCLMHHGDWDGRTTPYPSGFESYISSSGIQDYYPLSELPAEASGSIQRLRIESQQEAFENIMNPIKCFIDVSKLETLEGDLNSNDED